MRRTSLQEQPAGRLRLRSKGAPSSSHCPNCYRAVMRTSLSLLVIADDHKRPHGGDRIAAVVQVLPAILAAVGMTARRLAFVVSIAVADLAANLTGREVHGVNIAIGGIGDERRYQRVEIAGRDVLRGGADHVCARDHSYHGSAGRPTSL